MTISDSTVAIIGTGNIGSGLAANFAAGGQDFLLAGRDQGAGRKLASSLGSHAEATRPSSGPTCSCSPSGTAPSGSSSPTTGERLAGKMIVDPTNPIRPEGAGGYRKVIGGQESSGQTTATTLAIRQNRQRPRAHDDLIWMPGW